MVTRERQAEYREKWRTSHPGEREAYDKKWYAANRDRRMAQVRTNYLKREFGWTEEDYEAMLASQGGVCAICREPEKIRVSGGRPRRLAIDHEHGPGGRVRGLLCYRCNTVLGQYELRREAFDNYLSETFR